jgi:hypothetical protein
LAVKIDCKCLPCAFSVLKVKTVRRSNGCHFQKDGRRGRREKRRNVKRRLKFVDFLYNVVRIDERLSRLFFVQLFLKFFLFHLLGIESVFAFSFSEDFFQQRLSCVRSTETIERLKNDIRFDNRFLEIGGARVRGVKPVQFRSVSEVGEARKFDGRLFHRFFRRRSCRLSLL